MQNDFPLAAGMLVTNGLRVVWTCVECSRAMTNLVAVKPVTSVSRPLDEHDMYCNVYEKRDFGLGCE